MGLISLTELKYRIDGKFVFKNKLTTESCFHLHKILDSVLFEKQNVIYLIVMMFFGCRFFIAISL